MSSKWEDASGQPIEKGSFIAYAVVQYRRAKMKFAMVIDLVDKDGTKKIKLLCVESNGGPHDMWYPSKTTIQIFRRCLVLPKELLPKGAFEAIMTRWQGAPAKDEDRSVESDGFVIDDDNAESE